MYRHVATKAELRDLVVHRWMEETMPRLRAVLAQTGPAPEQLRQFFDMLIAIKRWRHTSDPALFAAYRKLAEDAQTIKTEPVDELASLAAEIIRSGIAEGSLRAEDPLAAGRALLFATSRFHHPAHAAEWADRALAAAYEDVWRVPMHGLRVAIK